MRIHRAAAAAVCVLGCPLCAGLPSPQEAAALAFPQAVITRRDVTLGPAEAAKVRELAQRDLRSLWVVAFEARRDGKLVGAAFLDQHRVRTQDETALVAVAPPGRILRCEVVAFHEPQEYMAKEAWLRQFDGKGLDGGLALRREIRPLGGATLTATALVDAARRGLALYQVLYGGAK